MNFLIFSLVFLLATPAFAKESVPQFDFHLYPPQIFWALITFIVIYAMAKFYIIPRLGHIVEHRKALVERDTLEAEATFAKADELKVFYQAELDKARSEAHTLISQETEKMEREMNRRMSEMDRQFNDRVKQADHKLLKMKDAVLLDAKAVSQELIHEVVMQLTGQDLDKKIITHALDEVFKNYQA